MTLSCFLASLATVAWLHGAKGHIYTTNVELIIHCISVAAVNISVESVVESLVSRYENHLTPTRQGIEKDHAREEMIISENGPLLQHADSIIDAAMGEYWKEKKVSGWQFVRTSENIRSYTGNASKVIG